MRDVEYLAAQKVETDEKLKVLIYAGADDYMCNWNGQKDWVESAWGRRLELKTLAINNASNGSVNSSTYGAFDRNKNFAIVRIDNAGHMVPHDQPIGTLDILKRFLLQ